MYIHPSQFELKMDEDATKYINFTKQRSEIEHSASDNQSLWTSWPLLIFQHISFVSSTIIAPQVHPILAPSPCLLESI